MNLSTLKRKSVFLCAGIPMFQKKNGGSFLVNTKLDFTLKIRQPGIWYYSIIFYVDGYITYMENNEFLFLMKEKGWAIFHEFAPLDLIHRLLGDLKKAYLVCRETQIRNAVPLNNEGTLHHLVELGQSFIEYLVFSEKLNPYFESYFQGKYILNSFGGNNNQKSILSYANNIHRDIRSYSGELPLLLNTLIMLDDFTAENGATFLMSESHRTHPELPSEEAFQLKAEQAIGKAGSILVFNSNVWHRAGLNKTHLPRRSITPMYCKPFIKQQYDYCRALGYQNVASYSQWLQQVLGFNARIPANLSEWYQPKENRMYQADQG